jgi:hypothetical protein
MEFDHGFSSKAVRHLEALIVVCRAVLGIPRWIFADPAKSTVCIAESRVVRF